MNRHAGYGAQVLHNDFCSLHHERQDIQKWADRRFPAIHFDAPRQPVSKGSHAVYMRMLFDGQVVSRFHPAFLAAVRSRRPWGEGEDHAIPPVGYYGLTGMLRLLTYFEEAYADCGDSDMHRSTVHFYVQVMLPEAVLLLIQDDLDVRGSAALDILADREVRELGLRVHAGEGEDTYASPFRKARRQKRL